MGEKIGKLGAKYVDARCPNCGFKISQEVEVESARDESYFIGYKLKCPKCSYEFHYRLY